MSKLVHGNVKTFIVHSTVANTCAQVCFFTFHRSAPGMTGASGCIHLNLRGNIRCFVRFKAKFSKDVWYILLKSLTIGVFCFYLPVKLGYVNASTRFKAIVPYVKR